MVTIPDIAAENYYLILKADGKIKSGELSEANNVWVVPMTNSLPDLTPVGMSLSRDTLAGQSYSSCMRSQIAARSESLAIGPTQFTFRQTPCGTAAMSSWRISA